MRSQGPCGSRSVSALIRVGRLTLYPFSALPKQNGRPNQLALRNGFLAHDVLWGLDPDCTAFEECVARSTLDIDTFWARALVEDDFPVDFYAAGGG